MLEQVQRQLGRLLMRFQSLEGRIKSVVMPRFVHAATAGIGDGFRSRNDDVKKAPLGWLKEELLVKYVHPEGVEPIHEELERAAAKGRFAIQLSVQIPKLLYETLVQDMTALHESRNKLVHHFLDEFDVATVSGCIEAKGYLEALDLDLEEPMARVGAFLDDMARVHGDLAPHLLDAIRHDLSSGEGSSSE